MAGWNQVDEETLKNLLSASNESQQSLLLYIHANRVCRLEEIAEKFPDLAESLIDYLSVIGAINNKLYRKFGCAIYPKQPAYTLQGSGYALGKK